MIKKSKYLLLILGLILLVLLINNYNQSDEPDAIVTSGRIISMEDQTSGLAGVSLLIVDEVSSHVETDEGGYFEAALSNEAVIIPRKTGYSFVPERQVVGEVQEIEFVAQSWAEPDFANWEIQFSFDSHSDLVSTVAFSQDDKYIASGSDDRTIRIWKIDDGQLVNTMTGHTSAINVIAFAPQGNYLASGARDGTIKIWDWQSGLEVKTLRGHTDLLTDLAWSPDGTMLASSGWDRKVRVWDFATGNELQSFDHENWVRAVAWSPDSRLLFSGGDNLSLKVWQVDSGELSADIETRANVMFLSAAPKESLVAMVLKNGALEVLNFETGERVALEQYQGEVTALSWSSEATYLAVGIDRLVLVWDWEKQELVQSINTGNYVYALAWGKESHLLASGSYRGIVDLWSAESGENVLKLGGHTSFIKALAWSPQGGLSGLWRGRQDCPGLGS